MGCQERLAGLPAGGGSDSEDSWEGRHGCFCTRCQGPAEPPFSVSQSLPAAGSQRCWDKMGGPGTEQVPSRDPGPWAPRPGLSGSWRPSLWPHPSSLCLWGPAALPSLSVGSQPLLWGHPDPACSHRNMTPSAKTSFQIRSHSQVPGGHAFWGNTVLPGTGRSKRGRLVHLDGSWLQGWGGHSPLPLVQAGPGYSMSRGAGPTSKG